MKTILLSIASVAAISASTKKTTVRIPQLEFEMSELEHVIAEETMQVHMALFERYAKQYNSALTVLTEEGSSQKKLLTQGGILNVLMNLEEIKNTDLQQALRYYGGGFINHYLFFNTLIGTESVKNTGRRSIQKPTGLLMETIQENFGSFDEFKKIFEQAQMSVLGSGWAWLVVEKVGNKKVKLAVVTTQNQDNPIMFEANKKNELIMPILGNDLFEHAYIFNVLSSSSVTSNKRGSSSDVVLTPHQAKQQYVKNFLKVVNWQVVQELFDEIVEQHGSQGMTNFMNKVQTTQQEEDILEEEENKMVNVVRGSKKMQFKRLGANPEELYIFS
jgi:Fe-Mn family superoxide dismutase